jgi:hypothetical protein
VAYLKAKNAPITKPGADMISEPPIDRAKSTARPPEARDAIMSISIMGFVAANSPDLAGDSISGFLFSPKGIKRDRS